MAHIELPQRTVGARTRIAELQSRAAREVTSIVYDERA